MKHLKILIIAIALPFATVAQDVNSSRVSPTSDALKVLAETSGDINNDGIKDVATLFESSPLMLTIFLSNKDGSYQTLNYEYIFEDLPKSDEFVVVEYSLNYTKTKCLMITVSSFATAGSWESPTCKYIFRYQNGDFYLIGESHESLYRNSGETTEVSINYLTGKQCTTEGNAFKKKKSKVKWETIGKKPLRSIGEVKLQL